MTQSGIKAIKHFESVGKFELANMIRELENAMDKWTSTVNKLKDSQMVAAQGNVEEFEYDEDLAYDSWVESNLCDQYEASLI